MVDARNAFNACNRKTMLCVIRHRWPSASRFVFNFYRHAMPCIIRGTDGSYRTILSREGTAQGCPIAMYAYGILTLPLVEHCARHVKEADQQCYADDFAASGSLRTCAKYLKELRKIGPTVF